MTGDRRGVVSNYKRTMEKNIKFLGKDIKVAFNMATQIVYEKITGKAFTEDVLQSTEQVVTLYYAVILANNPTIDITLDDILTKAKGAEIGALSAALTESFLDWAQIPETLTVDKEKPAEAEEEGSSPNA